MSTALNTEQTNVPPGSLQPDCSTAFVVAAKALLRQWMTKHAGHYRPGGWDYDKEGAQLVQDTADLLGVKDPWKQQNEKVSEVAGRTPTKP
jgi:hypothetical protein